VCVCMRVCVCVCVCVRVCFGIIKAQIWAARVLYILCLYSLVCY
jgi:hypothetical protein